MGFPIGINQRMIGSRRQFLQRGIGATAAAFALPAVTRAATTQPIRRPANFYGVNIDAPYPVEERSNYPKLVQALKDSGAGSVRMSIGWRYVEPRKGDRLWTPTDTALAALPKNVDILMLMLSTPDWASGVDAAKSVGWFDTYMPKNYDDWGNFFYDSVKRYRGRVKYWEVWNEENGVDFFRPMPDPKAYVRLLKTAYIAAKKADPECKVVLGGMQMNGVIANPWSPVKTPNFLEDVYKAGGGPYFDICNTHPYVLPSEGAAHMMELTRDTRKVMAKYGDANKPLWLTELGCGTGNGTTIEDQAKLLATCYEAAAEYSGIDRLFWFTFRDFKQNILGPEASMGMIQYDWRRKPAFTAFQRLAAQN
jgi:hypothetical protein